MKQLKRIAILLAIIVAVLFIWTDWVQFVVLSYSSARMFSHKTWKVPQPLPDTSVSQAAARKLMYVGFEFEVPWIDLDESQTKTLPKDQPAEVVALAFKSGQRMIVSAAPRRSLSTTLTSEHRLNKQSIEAVLGHGATDSDYNFHGALYQFTPDRMHKWSIHGDLHVAETLLLTAKAVSLGRVSDSGIFEIRNQDFQGFQQGNPSAGVKWVRFELFDNRGAVEVTVDSTHAQFAVTQPEVNRIIQSIHRVN